MFKIKFKVAYKFKNKKQQKCNFKRENTADTIKSTIKIVKYFSADR